MARFRLTGDSARSRMLRTSLRSCRRHPKLSKPRRAGKCWEPAEKELKLPKYSTWPNYEAALPFVVRRYCAACGDAALEPDLPECAIAGNDRADRVA